MDEEAVRDESDFLDKMTLFRILPHAYKRQITSVSSSKDYPKFEKFVLENPKIIIKPNYECLGNGIFVEHINSCADIKPIFQKLICSDKEWIIEPYIKQDKRMSIWNSTCVNTVRYYSIVDKKGRYHTLTPVLRTGRDGSVVDNAGSGGIFATIDSETGIVNHDAVDERGNRYSHHPDTNVKFEGFIVPEWGLLCKTVKQLHIDYLPNHRYIGWDWALSENGWCLIKANWGQFINQYVDNIGRRKEFFEYIENHV